MAILNIINIMYFKLKKPTLVEKSYIIFCYCKKLQFSNFQINFKL